MVELKIGDVISVAEAKKGTSDHGPWMLVPVKAERGFDKVTVWAANAKDAQEIVGYAKVLTMDDAKISGRKVGDKWYSDFSVRCTLAQADSTGNTDGKDVYTVSDILEETDDELPF